MRTKRACALLLLLNLLACGLSLWTSAEALSIKPKAQPASSHALVREDSDQVPVYSYEIVATYPHDTKAYTQGLVYYDGMLYESTGQYDESSLRKVELKKGKVKKQINVPNQYFAEGMTILNGKIYQLTWQSEKGFIYDLKDFKFEREFNYAGEGWGLTNDGKSLILSDGTNQLRFIDPATFQVTRTISVSKDKEPLSNLNELEYIRGEIYANIWKTDMIARIDPTTGHILAWIDLKGLRPPETLTNGENVLNGIAFDAEHERLYVTGKRWPKLFEIRLKK